MQERRRQGGFCFSRLDLLKREEGWRVLREAGRLQDGHIVTIDIFRPDSKRAHGSAADVSHAKVPANPANQSIITERGGRLTYVPDTDADYG